MSAITYTAPPTVARFMASTAFFRLLAGPVGSGKTTGLIFEILRRAIEQKPGRDGMRRTRWAIVRTTLSQLKMTILLDLLSWFRQIITYKISDQLLTLSFNDVFAEIFLIPLEDQEDQKRLLSMNLTGVAINEAIEMDPDLIAAIAGRCGRFPSTDEGGCSWYGIIADTNFPIEASPWHMLMEDDRPADWSVFKQPGGLEPNAENLSHLPGGREYYLRLSRSHNSDWVKRYVHAQYGEDPSGSAVFRESFKRSFHTVDSLDPVHGSVILVGQDFGRHPCSLVAQVDHKGRLLVLDELVAEDTGLEAHASVSLRAKLFTPRYMGKQFACVGDPSGAARDNREESCFDTLSRLGFPAFPAVTNRLDPRLRAVEQLLLTQRDAGPALIIDRGRCPNLVRAMGGAYRYAKTKQGETKPVPEKTHPWSDLADALQYLCLTVQAGLQIYITRKIRPRSSIEKKRPRVSPRGWT